MMCLRYSKKYECVTYDEANIQLA